MVKSWGKEREPLNLVNITETLFLLPSLFLLQQPDRRITSELRLNAASLKEGQDERVKSRSLVLVLLCQNRSYFIFGGQNIGEKMLSFYVLSFIGKESMQISCWCPSLYMHKCLCSFLSVTAKAELLPGSCSFQESICDYVSDPAFLSWTLNPSGEFQQPVNVCSAFWIIWCQVHHYMSGWYLNVSVCLWVNDMIFFSRSINLLKIHKKLYF